MGEGTILLHGLIVGDYGPDRRALRSLLERVLPETSRLIAADLHKCRVFLNKIISQTKLALLTCPILGFWFSRSSLLFYVGWANNSC